MNASPSSIPIGELMDRGSRAGVTVRLSGDETQLKIVAGAEGREIGKAIREREAEAIRHLTGAPDPQELCPVPERQTLPYQPFPVGELPEVVRAYVREEAAAINCDPALVAMPALAVCCATVGGARCCGVKRGWYEPLMLWICLVAESGGGKSPAAQRIMAYAKSRDRDARQRNAERMREYEQAKADHQRDQKAWEKKREGPPPEEPVEPSLRRHVTQDATIEQLIAILADNPRGVLCHVDELASLLGGFDKYKPTAKAAERSHYLSIWSNEAIMLDRKISTSSYADSPHVTVYGGIQPQTVGELVSASDEAAGLPARFLFATPPTPAIRWSDDEADETVVDGMCQLVDKLAELNPVIVERENQVSVAPATVYLDRASRDRFKCWHDQNRCRVDEAEGGLRAALAKMPSQLPRLALTLHCIESVSGEHSRRQIGIETLERAIVLIEWFVREAERFYQYRELSREDRNLLKHVEWINRRGGRVTSAELQRGRRSVKDAIEAERALNELVRLGFGWWEAASPGPKGGRPSRVFRLNVASASTKPEKPLES